MAPQNTSSGIGNSRVSKGLVPQNSLAAPIAPSNPLEGLYTSALQTSAGDYDSIMDQYRKLATSPLTAPTPIVPTEVGYTGSPEFQKAMSNYSTMASTGGYSPQDQQNIRARGISPIRAIYANAQQNLNRQRSLQGGYSPNYTAASARLSRDVSDQVSNVTTNVNAQLAQMIAEGKRFGVEGHGRLAANENITKNELARLNAEAKNRAAEINAARELEIQKANADRALQSVTGQQSLYGTTPALANTFGSQVLQALGLIQQGQIAQPPIPISPTKAKGGIGKVPAYGSLPAFG